LHALVSSLRLFLLCWRHAALGRCDERGLVGADTPLHIATFNGHEEVVKVLIERKADPTALDDDGKTVIQLAQALLNPAAGALTPDPARYGLVGNRSLFGDPARANGGGQTRSQGQLAIDVWHAARGDDLIIFVME